MEKLICPKCKIRKRCVILSGKNKGKYSGLCSICNKKNSKEWYLKNRLKKINKTKAHQKRTNYASEKTPKQRRLRYIKRRTRLLYPLGRKQCDFCNKIAEEHHHTSFPIEVHKFVYCCHNCHRKMHEGKNLSKSKLKGGLI